ncbi:MAG TPA: patatin-like phospholipase family protein, partial [Blastocatellia bacterium]|nr:patatin-like phospholipase family protein [Blastocatellia bacterium]
RLREARALERSSERPYIPVVDGGVADNLGLRGVIEALEILEASPAIRKLVELDRVERIAIIVVNAHAKPDVDWDRSESPPGIVTQIVQASGVPIDRYSYESIQLIKDTVDRWRMQSELQIHRTRSDPSMQVGPEDRRLNIALFAIDVSFQSIADPAERRYFQNLPTSLSLPSEAIDRLRHVAAQLLDASPEFNAFVRDLGRR